jgi:AraC family transcriptional regulator
MRALTEPPPAIDEALFSSALVKVGRFRCGVHDRLFRDEDVTREHCFVFPRTAVWIQHDGEKPFVADSNTIPLYNPGEPYRRRAISPDGDRTDWFSIEPCVLREVLAACDPAAADRDRIFRLGVVPSSPAVFLAQRRIFRRVRETRTHDPLLVEESVLTLLARVMAGTRWAPLAPTPAHRELVEHVREELNRSFARGDGLQELARSVGCSAFHLCRVFARVTGMTIHQYRTQLRLRRSLELLQSADADILAVGLAVGYSSHSHFTSAFHRAFGVTPSEFRLGERQGVLRGACSQEIRGSGGT